jgi:hypothetical protein
LHTGHLGAYINTYIGTEQPTRKNVNSPKWVGAAHIAAISINKGDELLVPYGSQHRRIIGDMSWLNDVEWWEPTCARARSSGTCAKKREKIPGGVWRSVYHRKRNETSLFSSPPKIILQICILNFSATTISTYGHAISKTLGLV